MLLNYLMKASLALSILILTSSLFAINATSSEIESTTIDVVEYNPFTSDKWPRHPSEIPADVEFIRSLFTRTRVDQYFDGLRVARDQVHRDEESIEEPIQTTPPEKLEANDAVSSMGPPARPSDQGLTTITTVRKGSPSGWTAYGSNHGWAMVCYDQKDHTDYCYRYPRNYYCSSNGYLVRRTTNLYGRYAPCETWCRCHNINPKPNCILRWDDQTTCF